MTQVQVDQVLQQKLGGMDRALEFCNSDGRVVGRYLPEEQYRELLYGSIEIPYSDAEIDKFRAEQGGCTLEEIWKRLGRQ